MALKHTTGVLRADIAHLDDRVDQLDSRLPQARPGGDEGSAADVVRRSGGASHQHRPSPRPALAPQQRDRDRRVVPDMRSAPVEMMAARRERQGDSRGRPSDWPPAGTTSGPLTAAGSVPRFLSAKAAAEAGYATLTSVFSGSWLRARGNLHSVADCFAHPMNLRHQRARFSRHQVRVASPLSSTSTVARASSNGASRQKWPISSRA